MAWPERAGAGRSVRGAPSESRAGTGHHDAVVVWGVVGAPLAQRERCRSTSGDGPKERELGAASHDDEHPDAGGGSTQGTGKIRSGITHLHSIGTSTVIFKPKDW